ncbi:hypothetical protein [Priestia endophytica]|uniref:TraC-like domain-containing protein n=1 Tax=Priestia endophytica DSM 13796 TaxID=1121089 RepID=A0A1I6BZY9_9BACI|nr:hypothetical protein [Priestia endophytica]KYG33469.1 hypothetical protein AZF06_21740 [Priestia endophytica]SFQ86496.1 hypothetical protein SAMN02745910_04653 [Priestia endophytica DSM 13796]
MFGKKKEKQETSEQTVQELIPIRNIYNEMVETKDNRLIKILTVTSVNISLMSRLEQQEVLENYESFLKTIDKPIQVSRVSTPVNLEEYIENLQNDLDKIQNPYKKIMQKSYIWYANNIQEDRDMIRRNRYIVLDESFNGEKSKQEAIRKLAMRCDDYKLRIEEMLQTPKLQARELTNKELENYFHMFYDYQNAQITNIENESATPYVIGRRNLLDTVERLKANNDYYVR